MDPHIADLFGIMSRNATRGLGNMAFLSKLMSVALKRVWLPRAQEFLRDADTFIDWKTGRVQQFQLNQLAAGYEQILEEDFIVATQKTVTDYAGKAYDLGLVRPLSKVAKARVYGEEIDEKLISQIAAITVASRDNILRAIRRWFQQTDGRYFSRFIIPYVAKLAMLLDEAEGRVQTLNKTGRRYKSFVLGEAHWDRISDVSTAEAFVWAEIDSMHEAGHTTYAVRAIMDGATCPVCSALDGSTWSVEEAKGQVISMVMMDEETRIREYPFPRMRDLERYPTPQESPYGVPPYHCKCRCWLEPI